MDVLGAHSFDTLVELEREEYRTSLSDGEAFFLVAAGHSFCSFLETPPLCSTLH